MSSTYTDVRFLAGQPDAPTARKLNLLIDDLSTAIAAGGGGGTGTGDMTKAVYDTNNNGKVDTCDAVPWGSVTGKPVIGDMTRAVYDTNGNNKVDAAENADAVAWTGVTGKPATFPPDATAELVAHKGAVNGYPSLDATGKVPTSQLPAFGTGDMTKSVYDTNGNNVVDTCDSLAWGKVTGTPATFPSDWNTTANKPSTFPPDSTAMLKATYDVNGNGKVDGAETADTVAWTGVTGKPSTFPPDSTAMLKATYDTNNDGISDHAALADTAPWAGITGRPANFVPSAHATTHQAGSSDILMLDTLGAPTDITTLNTSTTAHGLCPKLPGTTTTYLRGDGSWQVVPGGGDMLKSTYDVNTNGIVDKAEALSTAGTAHQFWKNGNVWAQPDWSDLTGVPATFPPDTSIDPGTWASVTTATGWSAGTISPQYRIESIKGTKIVYFRGSVLNTVGAAPLAFTLPAAAYPPAIRTCVLAGIDADFALFIAQIDTSGNVSIKFAVTSPFVWANGNAQTVYLDSLFFHL